MATTNPTQPAPDQMVQPPTLGLQKTTGTDFQAQAVPSTRSVDYRESSMDVSSCYGVIIWLPELDMRDSSLNSYTAD